MIVIQFHKVYIWNQTRKIMVKLEKLALIREKIVKDSDGRIDVKAIPVGSPVVLLHKGHFCGEERVSFECGEDVNAYTQGRSEQINSESYATPIQYYKIL